MVGWWGAGVLAVRTIGRGISFVELEGFREVSGGSHGGEYAKGTVAIVGGGEKGCVYVMQPMMLVSERRVRKLTGKEEPEPERDPLLMASESHEWPDTLNIGWTLNSLVERTPDEMLELYLKRHAWARAHALATNQGLDSDRVYKYRWTATPIDEWNVKENLEPVTDRRWVIEQCGVRVADSVQLQRSLFECGVRETEKWYDFISNATDGAQVGDVVPQGGIADREWLLQKRMELIGAFDRMETFCEVQEGGYSAQAYAVFRDCDLVDAARAFAAFGDLMGVQILVQRHTRAVFHKLLDILSCIPETTDPGLYAHLLPAPGSTPKDIFAPAREADWSENPETLQVLKANNPDMKASCTPMLTEPILTLDDLETQVLGADALTEWYTNRALDIDTNTGQLSFSKALLQIGVDKGLSGSVTELLKSVQVLSGTVKGSQAGWSVGLQEFSTMSRSDRIRVLLEGSTISSLELDLEERILPFFAGLDDSLREEVLADLYASQMGPRLGASAWQNWRDPVCVSLAVGSVGRLPLPILSPWGSRHGRILASGTS
eukprot:evm.model.scf_1.18 EVM.evm.TU.scf_1.18   scf_1:336773-339914(+)